MQIQESPTIENNGDGQIIEQSGDKEIDKKDFLISNGFEKIGKDEQKNGQFSIFKTSDSTENNNDGMHFLKQATQ